MSESEATPATTEIENGQAPAEAENADKKTPVNDEPNFGKKRFDEINAKLKAANDRLVKFEAAQADDDKAKAEAERKALEDQGKYEEALQKLQADYEKAETARRTAELAAIKVKAANKHGLSELMASRLVGETEDEIFSDAELIAKDIPQPVVPSQTDGEAGVNGSAPTQKLSDQEIREQAAIYGISVNALKQSLGVS